MTHPCDCCATRGGVIYRTGCKRCSARDVARMSARERAAILVQSDGEFAALVREEIAADAADPVRAGTR